MEDDDGDEIGFEEIVEGVFVDFVHLIEFDLKVLGAWGGCDDVLNSFGFRSERSSHIIRWYKIQYVIQFKTMIRNIFKQLIHLKTSVVMLSVIYSGIGNRRQGKRRELGW